MKKKRSLEEKYPPSEPCACEICRAYCARPGWWTVEEARRAMAQLALDNLTAFFAGKPLISPVAL